MDMKNKNLWVVCEICEGTIFPLFADNVFRTRNQARVRAQDFNRMAHNNDCKFVVRKFKLDSNVKC